MNIFIFNIVFTIHWKHISWALHMLWIYLFTLQLNMYLIKSQPLRLNNHTRLYCISPSEHILQHLCVAAKVQVSNWKHLIYSTWHQMKWGPFAMKPITHVDTDTKCHMWTSPETHMSVCVSGERTRGSPWRWPSAQLPGGWWVDGFTPRWRNSPFIPSSSNVWCPENETTDTYSCVARKQTSQM